MRHRDCLLDILSALLVLLTICNAELNFDNDLENSKKFQSIPTTIKTFENDTVLLPCSSRIPFRYVRWHRDNVPLADSRHPEVLPPERIRLWSNGSLQVSNVQAEDTGDYYCEIMSSSSHDVQQHSIEVQYSPSVITKPSGLLELHVGTTFEVVCLAEGVPLPAITWRLNGNNIDKLNNKGNRQSHIFEIKNRDMSGLIECLATNGVGQPAVSGVYLHALFVPELSVPQNVVYTKVGERAQLECVVESAPAAELQWFHHGVPVHMSAQINNQTTELQTNHSRTHYISKNKHMLIFKKVREADMGQYECRAHNNIGFKSATIELTGRPMPCVFKMNPGAQSSTSHILVWQTESLLPVMEFMLRFRQIPSGNATRQSKTNWTDLTIPAQATIGPIYITSYTLHGLQPASLFEVSVLARNSFGWSDNSKTIRFTTGGEVELPNYSMESEMRPDATEEDLDNEITDKSQMVYTASMTHNKASTNEYSAFIAINLILQMCFAL